MRIGILAAARYPLREPWAGGMESHTAELAVQLRRAGHHVSVFGPAGSDPSLVAPGDELTEARFSSTAVEDTSTPSRAFMQHHHAYLELALRLQDEARDRFDVIHDNALHYLTVGMAGTFGVPVVGTLHTPPTTWLESALDAPLGGATVRWCAVSEHNARQWEARLPGVTIVPNGVDTRTFVAGRGGGPAVWTGRLVPEKGADHAVRAARLAGVPLRLAGPVLDRPWFDAVLEPLLGGDVEHVGHLGTGDLAALVGESSVALVTPRWDEPYGLVVAEALACGTPVAAYRRGAVPDLVDAACGALAEPDDPQSLAVAVTTATGLSRAAARTRAVTHCSSTRMAARYAHVYAEEVERRQVRPNRRTAPTGRRPG